MARPPAYGRGRRSSECRPLRLQKRTRCPRYGRPAGAADSGRFPRRAPIGGSPERGQSPRSASVSSSTLLCKIANAPTLFSTIRPGLPAGFSSSQGHSVLGSRSLECGGLPLWSAGACSRFELGGSLLPLLYSDGGKPPYRTAAASRCVAEHAMSALQKENGRALSSSPVERAGTEGFGRRLKNGTPSERGRNAGKWREIEDGRTLGGRRPRGHHAAGGHSDGRIRRSRAG